MSAVHAVMCNMHGGASGITWPLLLQQGRQRRVLCVIACAAYVVHSESSNASNYVCHVCVVAAALQEGQAPEKAVTHAHQQHSTVGHQHLPVEAPHTVPAGYHCGCAHRLLCRRQHTALRTPCVSNQALCGCLFMSSAA